MRALEAPYHFGAPGVWSSRAFLILSALALAGSKTAQPETQVQHVIVPAPAKYVDPKQRPREPPPVGSQFNGDAKHDLEILAPSAPWHCASGAGRCAPCLSGVRAEQIRVGTDEHFRGPSVPGGAGQDERAVAALKTGIEGAVAGVSLSRPVRVHISISFISSVV